MVDMNCPLDGESAIASRIPAASQPMFLEEPVWPPEICNARRGANQGGLTLRPARMPARHQFRQMMKAGAVSHAQASSSRSAASPNI
jgi:L-alanine-DL-glutamate epimerase-like enolase superfamily enzyme